MTSLALPPPTPPRHLVGRGEAVPPAFGGALAVSTRQLQFGDVPHRPASIWEVRFALTEAEAVVTAAAQLVALRACEAGAGLLVRFELPEQPVDRALRLPGLPIRPLAPVSTLAIDLTELTGRDRWCYLTDGLTLVLPSAPDIDTASRWLTLHSHVRADHCAADRDLLTLGGGHAGGARHALRAHAEVVVRELLRGGP